MSSLEASVAEFLCWIPRQDYRDQIQQLIDAAQHTQISELFASRLSFGTAGLRGAMGPGYCRMNELVVLQTTQGLVQAVVEQHQNQRKIAIVGYDARHNSKAYANVCARVFVDAGFKVYLFSGYCGTPFVPFAVRFYNALAGVMITASHNPKQDNGYKVYWSNGAQIIPPNDEKIAEKILENLVPWEKLQGMCKDGSILGDLEYGENVIDPLQTIEDAYMKGSLKYSFQSPEINEKSNLKICYTAMHGVGYKFVKKAFESVKLPQPVPVPEQVYPDPDFPTVAFPNPEEGKGALALAINTAQNNDCSIILGNDPDADRLAVAEKVRNVNGDDEWKIFSGNEIAALLADWTWQNFKKKNPNADFSKCCMIASTVSSKFLQAMAKAEGFSFFDTLTGFKWMGNTALSLENDGYTLLFAYEVEIGFLVGNLSYDKDGIRTSAIFAEMSDYHYRNGRTLSQHLQDLRKRYGYFEMNASYFFCHSKPNMDRLFESLRNHPESYPKSLGEYTISSVRDVTKGLDSQQANGLSILPRMPKDHMITFRFTNGSVVTIRNSGTEPKVKYYVECQSKNDPNEAHNLLTRLSALLISEWLRPSEYELISSSNK